ncbi:OstA-like protein [Myroides pelagicus]|uniref:OstA-like protein n=1 Tax=Myroides pelagicus TaxID=270914 RepID=A0A7K1GQ05_9FLAO|nr:OstA-like protein [Myroides pelagicus]MEC4114687.1 OstA-like protein [Myroides pelagicus]MTH30473.1 OstA-like protein [Myroides pelagicus]
MRALPISFILLLFTILSFSQTPNKDKIIIHHADRSDINEELLPNAVILTGNILAEHDGMTMQCNKAYYFRNEEYLKLFGNVHIVQQDTLSLDSKYAEYNALNGFAYAQGDVELRSPDSTLSTDTLKFDRNQNLVYYDNYAKITNKGNILESDKGKYYSQEKKFQFTNAVKITTENETIVKSNHLDYYEVPEHAYVYGPSTITNKEDFIYTENGFYDVNQDIGKLLKNSYIWYDQRKLEADSIYYSKLKDFASASYNVTITDTINKAIITSHYAEMHKSKDSIYITKKPLVKKENELNDTVYLHAKIITLTGKEKQRVIKAYKGARILRDSLSGKADSIHTSEQTGLTQMIGRPILWNGESQLSGKLMHLISDIETEKMDSLKVLEDAFVIERDTVGTGYNQIKGVNLYGKFKDNKISEIDVIKNAEIVYYMYNEKNEFIGIDKGICSHINVTFEDNKIATASRLVAPTSTLYPDDYLPENARKLRGFEYRGEERINGLKDIFPQEELDEEKLILEEIKKKQHQFNAPIEVQKETIEAESTGDNLLKDNNSHKTEQQKNIRQPNTSISRNQQRQERVKKSQETIEVVK